MKKMRVVLSTVYETFYEENPQGKFAPRVRIEFSDGTLAKYSSEFEERYKLLFSGSTVISIIEFSRTVSMARVNEFERGTLIPTELVHVFGKEIELDPLVAIEDKRWETFKGHPLEQIPKPKKISCPNPAIFQKPKSIN